MPSSLRKVVHPWKWLEARRQQQRAYRELIALDDSALADIGITRADIPYVVFGCRQAQREVEMRGSKKTPLVMQLSGQAAPCKGTEK